jgi:hypothetical protein
MSTRALLILGLLLAPAVASAQTTSPSTTYEQRGFIQFGGGAQSGAHDIITTSTFTIYDEQGTIAGTQEYGGGALWNIGGGVRVWRNLVAALNYTRNSDTMDTAVIARVPHPLFVNRPREANQRIGGLKHIEDGYHVSLQWMIPVGDAMTIGVGGGPSFVRVGHDFAESARVQETDAPPNYATVAITDIVLTRGQKTATTVNIGADLNYDLPLELGQTGKLGATLGFRYAGGTVGLPGTSGDVDVKYGGIQFWGGLRVSF